MGRCLILPAAYWSLTLPAVYWREMPFFVSGKLCWVAGTGEVLLYIWDMVPGPNSIAEGDLASLQGSWWSLCRVWWILVEQPWLEEVFIWDLLHGAMLRGSGHLLQAAPSSIFQLCCSLTVADILSTSKRPFMLNYGRIKQRQTFNWAAIQKAGTSYQGLSCQIHQGISTSCILNFLILKNKVIFSALEADICLQGLSVFL